MLRNMVMLLVLGLALLTGCAHWGPALAVDDAERDIAASKIRFAYRGGIAPYAPGLPAEATHEQLQSYGRRAVGSQGCIQGRHREEQNEYARLYNMRMWRHVTGEDAPEPSLSGSP